MIIREDLELNNLDVSYIYEEIEEILELEKIDKEDSEKNNYSEEDIEAHKLFIKLCLDGYDSYNDFLECNWC